MTEEKGQLANIGKYGLFTSLKPLSMHPKIHSIPPPGYPDWPFQIYDVGN